MALLGHAEVLSKREAFDPDWCVHPGKLLAEVIEDSGIRDIGWARLLGVEVDGLRRVLDGKARFTAELAERVGGTNLVGPARLWKRLVEMYDEGVVAGKTRV